MSSESSSDILQQQLELLENDVSTIIGVKKATNKKRRRKRVKKTKRKKSDLQQVAQEQAKRAKIYKQNVKKLTKIALNDISVDFVKKVFTEIQLHLYTHNGYVNILALI